MQVSDRVGEWIEEHGEDRFFEEAVILCEEAPGDVREGPLIAHRHEDGFGTLTASAAEVSCFVSGTSESVAERVRMTGDARENGGDGGDEGVTGVVVDGERLSPVPMAELGIESDQGVEERKTVRNLDRVGLDVVRERTGVDSDSAAVRKAVKIAKRVLTE